jgi:beta-N-acetylglucosaminidase
MSSSGLIYFDSVESGLEGAAKTLHNNYLTQGGRFYYGKTLEAMRTRFCPVNPGWTSLVYGRMQQIVK